MTNTESSVDAGTSVPQGPPETVTTGVVETALPKTNHPPPEKFDGKASEWKMWKKKMFFYLTTMNLQKYTSETKPDLPAGNTDKTVLATVQAWEHSDYLCKGFILNSLSDSLFRFYSEDAKTSKALWEALDKKYRTEDSGTQKFVVAKFRRYQMVDSRPVMEQVAEVQTLLHEIHAEGMQRCETYQGSCIIDMLPPSWGDFKNYLRLKKKKMSLDDLIVKLRVESTNRENLGKGINVHESNANMVEYQNHKQGKWKGRQDKGKGKIPPRNSQKFKNKNSQNGQNGQTSQRFPGNCHFCSKPGHKAADCRSRKAQVNLTEADMCVVVTEANVAEGHPKTWWYDTGATRHICMDREMFSTYTECKGEEKLRMGNHATSKIEGHGSVVLKLTSAQELVLKNVVHV